jgi:plasmid stabilization system protein ParE
VKVSLSPTARRQIAELSAWWDGHRRQARVRVVDALDAAVTLMAEHPELGQAYSGDPRYRTWRLKGTPYVLFYRIDETAGAIWVVVAWSTKRGTGPTLP